MHHDEGVMLGRSGRASPGKGERQDRGPAAAGRRQGGGGQATLRADTVRGSRRAVERFRGWKKGEMMSNDQRRPFLAPLCLPAVGGPQPGSRNPWSMLLTAASCTQQASRVALFGAAAISHGERERE